MAMKILAPFFTGLDERGFEKYVEEFCIAWHKSSCWETSKVGEYDVTISGKYAPDSVAGTHAHRQLVSEISI